MSTAYTTAADAIAYEITPALTASGKNPEDYDLDGLVENNFEYMPEQGGFVQTTTTKEFWDSVRDNLNPPAPIILKCDMEYTCTEPVTHLDSSGWIYCTNHGIARRPWKKSRKLRPHELNRLKAGKQINRY